MKKTKKERIEEYNEMLTEIGLEINSAKFDIDNAIGNIESNAMDFSCEFSSANSSYELDTIEEAHSEIKKLQRDEKRIMGYIKRLKK